VFNESCEIEIFKAVNMKVTAFRDITPSGSADFSDSEETV
jgi:hypothetical protein